MLVELGFHVACVGQADRPDAYNGGICMGMQRMSRTMLPCSRVPGSTIRVLATVSRRLGCWGKPVKAILNGYGLDCNAALITLSRLSSQSYILIPL